MQPDTLQKEFISCVCHLSHDQDFFLRQLDDTHLPADLQLTIYKRNYSGSISKTLKQIYPVCLSILGDEYFETLAQLYLSSYPSMHHDLNTYGDQFCQLMLEQCQTNPLLQGYEYLPDLAQLEWLWHISYFLADNDSFDFEKLSSLTESDYENIYFYTSHSLKAYKSNYPVVDIWRDHCNNTPCSQYNYNNHTNYFCISRSEYTPLLDVITEDIYHAIKSIQSQQSLNELSKNPSFNIDTVLPALLKKQWITGFSLKDETC